MVCFDGSDSYFLETHKSWSSLFCGAPRQCSSDHAGAPWLPREGKLLTFAQRPSQKRSPKASMLNSVWNCGFGDRFQCWASLRRASWLNSVQQPRFCRGPRCYCGGFSAWTQLVQPEHSGRSLAPQKVDLKHLAEAACVGSAGSSSKVGNGTMCQMICNSVGADIQVQGQGGQIVHSSRSPLALMCLDLA